MMIVSPCQQEVVVVEGGNRGRRHILLLTNLGTSTSCCFSIEELGFLSRHKYAHMGLSKQWICFTYVKKDNLCLPCRIQSQLMTIRRHFQRRKVVGGCVFTHAWKVKVKRLLKSKSIFD
jgi:hypothetical protein